MSRYGLLGKKLGHSFSKIIHEEVMDYQYELIEKDEMELDSFFKNKCFNAINITVPYKEKVLEYLDELDHSVKKIQACNCIVNENGILKGYNTDYGGFKYLIKNSNVDLTNKKVCVLGNGGAAKSIIAVLKEQAIKELIIVKQNPSEETLTYQQLYQYHCDIDLIVNTSYVGMYPNNYDNLIDLSKFYQLETVIDIIYNPLHTQLIVDAKSRGLRTVGGLKMLVAQAIIAMEYFKNIKLDYQIIEDIYQKIKFEKINILLIGMPSSGKTTIAKYLSGILDKDFIDLDQVFENRYGLIKDYFIQFGETDFRMKESGIALEIAKENSLIVASGGGIVLNYENIRAFRQNSLIIYLQRDLKLLEIGGLRPLSKDYQELEKMYQKRHQLYLKYCDYAVENNGEINKTVNEIISIIKEKT